MDCQWASFIRQNGKCCVCEGPLTYCELINLVDTGRIATWDGPVARNVLIKNDPGHAMAVVCDECLLLKVIKPKYAIETRSDGDCIRIFYWPIDELEELPDRVKEDYLRLAIAVEILAGEQRRRAQEVNRTATQTNDN